VKLQTPNQSLEPSAVGAFFRCRGSRRESAVAQLFSLNMSAEHPDIPQPPNSNPSKNMKKHFLLISSSILLSVITASAIPITYTMTGVASGRLGTSTFTSAAYTISATANTSQTISSGSIFSVLDLTATIFVNGIGTAIVTVPFYTYDNQTTSEAGFYYGTSSLRPGVVNAAFSTYTLASSIGPLGGTSLAVGGIAINTTAGFFDTQPLSIATFQASTAVPDQASTLGLLSFGILALAGFRYQQSILSHRSA